MSEAQITIVVVPRERFSRSEASLERLYERTTTPFDLIYVDGGSPRPVRTYLREASTRHGFRLIRSKRYLSPNQARNLALPMVETPFVVFIDNDLEVTPGWLDTLQACADDTGAWAVGPLYLEGDPADEIIHMAAGDMEMSGELGSRHFTTTHRHQHTRLSDAPPLQREQCDFIEFHCALLRNDVFDRIGALDERLLSTREHLDLCLRIREAGGEVWFEPASVVTYVAPPPIALRDIPYFWLRWSDTWGRASLEHFCDTYGIDPSYTKRLSVMQQRRQVVFNPVRRAARRLLGRRVAHVLDRALVRTEPVLNRALVRTADRRVEIEAPAPG